MRVSEYEKTFLRKVLKKEEGNIKSGHKLLIMAVHSVFLESGFVPFDPSANMKMDGFHDLSKEWEKDSNFFVQDYTLPDLLGPEGFGNDAVESICLFFVISEKDLQVYVYGPLNHPILGKKLFILCLEKSRFFPSIKFVCLNNEEVKVENGSSSSSNLNSKSFHESEFFEFWKTTKDDLALPLLIELCDKTGVALPPCFMGLPTDLKLKILGLLSGNDIGRMARVSSELRYLCLNNDFLKQKVGEEV